MKIPIYIRPASKRKDPWEGTFRPQLDRAPIELVRTFREPGKSQGVSSDMANVNFEIGHFYSSRDRCGREDHTVPAGAMEESRNARIENPSETLSLDSIDRGMDRVQNTFSAIDFPSPVVESNLICAADN